MRSNAEIKRAANGIYAKLAENINRLEEVRAEQVKSITGADFQEDFKKVLDIVDAVEAMVKAGTYEDISLPSFLSKCESEIDDLSKIMLTIRTKLNAEVKHTQKYDVKVIGNADLVSDIASAYIDATFQMYYQEQALANIKEYNARVAEICAEYEVPCLYKLALEPTSKGVVLSITDECLVLNASVENAIDISSLAIFQEGEAESYSAMVRETAIAKFVEALKSAETPVQLLKTKVEAITGVTGAISRRRADKLIRETHHLQAIHLGKVKKGGLGYFDKTVKIDGVDTEVFAIVEKSPEGELSVVLTPFNRDLMNVDYDVLADIKAEMK